VVVPRVVIRVPCVVGGGITLTTSRYRRLRGATVGWQQSRRRWHRLDRGWPRGGAEPERWVGGGGGEVERVPELGAVSEVTGGATATGPAFGCVLGRSLNETMITP
jgi:hypothetical protein